MQMLNYSTHALEYYRRDVIPMLLQQGHLVDAKTLSWFCRLLSDAQKFRLPDGGRLLAGVEKLESFQKIFEHSRLPFPETVIEYAVFEGPDTLDNTNGKEIAYAKKRVGVAIDLNSKSLEQMPHLSMQIHALRRRYLGGGMLLASLFEGDPAHFDGEDAWEVPTVLFFQPYEQEILSTDENVTVSRWYRESMKVSARAKIPTLTSSPIVLLPALVDVIAPKMGGMDHFLDHAVFNLTDEAVAMVEFCAILNCSNVKTGLVPAPAKLNRKRASANKTPFFEYHVLELAPGGSETGSEPGGQTGLDGRLSPRAHLRRGHVRRLSSGKVVWVNAAMVGLLGRGVVDKDYTIKGV